MVNAEYLHVLFIDQEVGSDFCQDKLKTRKDILRKYLDNDNSLELRALFVFQEIYVKYNEPAGRY
jgi:tRNA splicing ligase